jgi:DNA-binding transcriptional ArsR family regulator
MEEKRMIKVLNLNFEQIKIISDKNKIEILNCFELEKPITVTEVSEKLGIPYSKISYHVKILEKVGLIEIVDTKIKSGIIEKFYSPVAEEFRIDKSISVFENQEEIDEYKKGAKDFYDSIFKAIDEDYKNWVDNMSSDKVDEGAMFCGTVFLNDEIAKQLRYDVEAFYKGLLDKYGDRIEGSKAYNIGNFLLVKKNQEQYIK